MTGRQRMTAALSGEMPDRVPFLPTIFVDYACLATGRRFEDALIDPRLVSRAMLDAAVGCGADGVRLRMGPARSWFDEKEVREARGQLLQYDRRTGRVDGVLDVAGGGRLVPAEPPPPLSTIAEVACIPVPAAAELIDRGCFEDVSAAVAEAHQRGLFVVGMAAGQTINFMVQQLGTAEAALLCFLDDPELAHALIAKAVAITTEQALAFVQVGVDGIYIGDSYASASVISPTLYGGFCVPAYRRLAQACHDAGVLCYKHCCGNYDPFFSELSTVGVDAMDGIDPTSGMTVARTKAAVGSTLTLMGGLSCLTLLQGTVAEVTAAARQCLEAGMPGGRYVLGSACAVPRLTPTRNLRAAQQATVSFGGY